MSAPVISVGESLLDWRAISSKRLAVAWVRPTEASSATGLLRTSKEP
jgi:hypothetical protein